MAGYTKEFLVDAFLSRYTSVPKVDMPALRSMSEKHYAEVGKDKFRVAASLDADALKKFKLETGRKS